uniref:KOW domain-containing protein n=1 Tax=Zea mays TaxID=4577 RepID=A0A804MHS7_MAIZE
MYLLMARSGLTRPTLLGSWMSFPSLRQMRTTGFFRLHPIRDEDAKFKLCKVRSIQFGQKGIPYLNTYNDCTIRYPDLLIKANDTIKIELETNKIMDFIKFDVGNVVMVTGGRNTGRVGVIKNKEKHKG